jgi:methylenetetrahydrofolate--tRNA-(uracil-5-)-methyltransferase
VNILNQARRKTLKSKPVVSKVTKVQVIGAGLAGCEATYQLVKHGISVRLFEMRPKVQSPAHHTGAFAELVCSNSLRSNSLENAVGLLKQEMRELDSLIMRIADATQVPAGSALAVDRELFAQGITNFLRNHPLVEIVEDEVVSIDESLLTIVASGPLTSDVLSKFLMQKFDQEYLYFYDAAAPIIERSSIDFDIAYYKSRYDKGDADYINCPMSKDEFRAFYQALINADTVKPKSFEKEIYFEGCMPFEEMAKRGEKTLLFGPMKPVGLHHNGVKPYAVVQLRQDNVAASLYNVVGFQTHLTWPEQRRILRMIPGLANCEIVRYGVMHRNTFINSPLLLDQNYRCLKYPNWFFAGQLTGVEGYVESAASGLLAALNMVKLVNGQELLNLGPTTMIGAMAYYISHCDSKHFQPMNANFGIFQLTIDYDKHEKKAAYARQSLAEIAQFKVQL